MDPAASALVEAVLTELVWLIGGGVLGLPITLFAIVAMLTGRRVPAVLGTAGLGLLVLVTLGAGLGGLYNSDAFVGGLAAGLIHMLAAVVVVLVAVPLLLGCVIEALRGERRWVGPLLFFVPVGLIVASTVAEGWAIDNLRFGVLRALVFAGTGSLAALSQAGGGERSDQPAVAGAVAFAIVVGVVETAERGLATALALFFTCQLVDYPLRDQALGEMLVALEPAVPWSLAAVGGAALAAVCVLVWRSIRDGMSPGHVAALLWVVLAVAASWVGMPQKGDLSRAAAAGPPRSEEQPLQ